MTRPNIDTPPDEPEPPTSMTSPTTPDIPPAEPPKSTLEDVDYTRRAAQHKRLEWQRCCRRRRDRLGACTFPSFELAARATLGPTRPRLPFVRACGESRVSGDLGQETSRRVKARPRTGPVAPGCAYTRSMTSGCVGPTVPTTDASRTSRCASLANGGTLFGSGACTCLVTASLL